MDGTAARPDGPDGSPAAAELAPGAPAALGVVLAAARLALAASDAGLLSACTAAGCMARGRLGVVPGCAAALTEAGAGAAVVAATPTVGMPDAVRLARSRRGWGSDGCDGAAAVAESSTGRVERWVRSHFWPAPCELTPNVSACWPVLGRCCPAACMLPGAAMSLSSVTSGCMGPCSDVLTGAVMLPLGSVMDCKLGSTSRALLPAAARPAKGALTARRGLGCGRPTKAGTNSRPAAPAWGACESPPGFACTVCSWVCGCRTWSDAGTKSSSSDEGDCTSCSCLWALLLWPAEGWGVLCF
jgi:hypothetical protein